MKTGGKVTLILGIIGMVLSGLTLVGALITPTFAHASPDEFMPFVMLGGGCCGVSLIPAAIGAVLLVMAKKQEQQQGT